MQGSRLVLEKWFHANWQKKPYATLYAQNLLCGIMVRGSGRNGKCDEYKWRQSLKRRGKTSDGRISVIGNERLQKENHMVTLMRNDYKAEASDIMSSGGIVWAEPLGWMKGWSMHVPRLPRHYNTWHKGGRRFQRFMIVPLKATVGKLLVIMYCRRLGDERILWENSRQCRMGRGASERLGLYS